MANDHYDVIVIGAGPAGYVAAIRCAQLGLKTACIDNWTNPEGNASPGGTCLNVGCIPSKALLESTALFSQTQNELGEHGISVNAPKMNVKIMQARKEAVVNKLTSGIGQLFKANKITFIHGKGRVLPSRKVAIMDLESGKIIDTLVGKNIIIATGSTPVELPGFKFDHKIILDSADTLALKSTPKHLLIVGAGVIGLELGSVWARLGAKVTILEAMDTLLPMVDAQIAREASRQYKKQGLDIILGAKVIACRTTRSGVTVDYELKGETLQIKGDKLAVMVGRKPNTEGVLAPDCIIETTPQGQIVVNEYCQTSTPGVWAIGDIVRGPMLAHKGSEEGIMVAESIASQKLYALDLGYIPSVIYTQPEIAWIGKTEAELKAADIDYVKGQFPFAASGRAQASGHTDGMIKVLSDKKTDRILGVHMIGEHTSELLAEAVFAMQYQGSAEDLGRTIHSHPSLSEALKEAALNVHKEAIHKMN
jgi:dihydrolipoamide dehydrogenase